jgi:hypothetical protein
MTDTGRLPALLILLLVAGCGGPTRTAGTRGVAARDLSVFSVAQLPKASPVQIHTVQFKGDGEAYEIGKGRDFYLLPRDQAASFTLSARIPKAGGGIAGMFIPKGALTLPGPRDVPLGAMAAGKTYELIRPDEGFDFAELLQGGGFSLVREKGK